MNINLKNNQPIFHIKNRNKMNKEPIINSSCQFFSSRKINELFSMKKDKQMFVFEAFFS